MTPEQCLSFAERLVRYLASGAGASWSEEDLEWLGADLVRARGLVQAHLQARRAPPEPARPGPRRIDRIDTRGDIREHYLRDDDDDRTLCGLRVEMSQPALGNGLCRTCERLARQRGVA